MNPPLQITPRKNLDFDLKADIPRFWFGADPFKTRLFDAHSLLTPPGESFFILCLRDYQDEISDPQLSEDVRNFIFQEGQHSLQHGRSNERMRAQGVAVDAIEAYQRKEAELARKCLGRKFCMALTAAYEHLTTITAHAVIERSDYLADADAHIFALYAWHCAEELEHKCVCFDVMQKVARVGYLMRVTALLFATLMFQTQAASIMNQLLRLDGFSFRQRAALWWRGMKWMYGRQGFFRIQLGHYFAYLHPRFHPSQRGGISNYVRWEQVFRATADPLAAAAAIR